MPLVTPHSLEARSAYDPDDDEGPGVGTAIRFPLGCGNSHLKIGGARTQTRSELRCASGAPTSDTRRQIPSAASTIDATASNGARREPSRRSRSAK